MSNKLTKKQESEVLKAYSAYFDSYIKGDIKAIEGLLDDNYTQIGSAEAEVFFDKKEAMQFLNDTIDQVAGKAEMRNRRLKVEPKDGLVLVVDIFDMYVLINEEWTYYAQLRASTLMEKGDKGWKFVYQHSSMPDTRAIDGDNIAIEKISAENQQLREAVKRRTNELENKNRELEIEAGLERVRARAMAMHHSDELLEVAIVLRHEIAQLDGLDLESSVIHIYPESKKTFEAWYSFHLRGTDSDQLVNSFANVPVNSCAWTRKVLKEYNSSNTEYSITSKGKMLNDWYKVLDKILPEVVEYDAKGNMLVPSVLHYNFSKFSGGALMMVTHELIDNETRSLWKRATSVFDLSYRRFLDLQKAEEQTREAQIEAALERVRSRSMAMQLSEEMPEVANNLFLQVQELGFPAWSAGYCIWEEDKKSASCSMSSEGVIQKSLNLPTIGVGYDFTTPMKNGEPFHIAELGGKELVEHYKFMRTLPGFDKVLDEIISAGFDLPTFQIWHIVYFKNGYLMFITYEPVPEAHDIFNRFAGVFEQTYTRFLDLQKAETQAREAKIEAALEKVRSSSLAMHKSEELSDVGNELLQQIKLLGIHVETSWFWFIDQKIEEIEIWVSHKNKIADLMKFNASDYDTFKHEIDAWKNKEPFFKLNIPALEAKKALAKFFAIKLNNSGKAPLFHLLQTRHDYGFLGLGSWSELSDEEMNISSRFAKVFEQAYTRFLDIQKAEEQAREAQIEAALERVRSRSMAMHSTDELWEVINVVSNQFELLNISIDNCFINILDANNKDFNIWVAAEGQAYPEQVRIPYIQNAAMSRLDKARKDSEKFYTQSLNKKTKDAFFYHFFDNAKNIKVSKKRQNLILKGSGFTGSVALSTHATITISNYRGLSYNDDENLILQRITQVFDQTYSRFLDLQKAEAQAREAQIETALEKVRSRSLAMQKSEELEHVIQVVYEQMVQLGINAEHAGFAVDYEEEGDWNYWVADPNITSKVTVPHFDSVWSKELDQAIKVGDDFFATALDFKAKNKFYRDLLKHVPTATKKARDFYLKCKGLAISTAIQKDVLLYIENFSGTPYSEEENGILLRFGRAFQQTYTRFLDLQKAEAQVREAEIELALERVRARTMAMHKSDELGETAYILFQEMLGLGVQHERFVIAVLDEENKQFDFWGTEQGGNQMNTQFTGSIDEPTSLSKFYRGIKDKKKSVIVELAGKDLASWISYMKKTLEMPLDASMVREKRIHSCGIFSNGVLILTNPEHLPPEHIILVERFAAVFDQTYTRFLDLQKAEAQGREAQIEAALEKVRSRSLAMHDSDELREVIASVFEQLKNLDFEVPACSLIIYQEDLSAKHWFAGFTKKIYPESYTIPYIDIPYYTDLLEAWQNKSEFEEFIMEGKAKVDYAKWLLKETEFKILPKAFVEQSGMKTPKPLYFADAYMSYGMIEIIGNEPLPHDQIEILKRFSRVFEQSYTRFLDLQKAEAQGREAQIELALERVRNKAMAMRSSEELAELVVTVFHELQEMDMALTRCLLWLFNEQDQSAEIWMANSENPNHADSYHVPNHNHPAYKKFLNGWKTQESKWQYLLKGKIKDSWDDILVYGYLKNLSAKVKKAMKAPESIIMSGSFNKYGVIQTAGLDPLTNENQEILRRFSQVFEQTYSRYLDLKKAEANAREAQIETALERVRSKTMAMHNSDDVGVTVLTLFHEVLKLGLDYDIRCGIGILEGTERMETRSATLSPNGEVDLKIGMLDMTIHPLLKRIKKAWKSSGTHYTDQMTGKDVIRYYTALNNEPDYPFFVELDTLPEKQFHNSFSFSEGILFAFSPNQMSEEAANVLNRFAAVFGQTYTRFLDLKKAEAQAHEAQIETSLERVRSRSLGMHKSSELQDVINVVLLEIENLGIEVESSYIVTEVDKDVTKGFYCWLQNNENNYAEKAFLPYLDHPLFHNFHKAWQSQNNSYKEVFTKKESNRWFRHAFKYSPQLGKIPEDRKKHVLDGAGFSRASAVQINCALIIQRYNALHYTEAELDIVVRFAKAFEQTYTRFLDLQKAEAQAEEAQIESALEKVRSRSIGMQQSEDLKVVIQEIHDQLINLKFNIYGAGFTFDYKQSNDWSIWFANQDQSAPSHIFIPYTEHPQFNYYKAAKEKGLDFFANTLSRKDKNSIFKYMFKFMGDYPEEEKKEILGAPGFAISQVFLKNITLWIYNLDGIPYSDKSNATLMRFAKVFEQSYVRFNDLKQAEAREIEAIKESSLDRVRAEIASMRNTTDLGRITPLVWRELTQLGVPFFRCGIFIVKEEEEIVHAYLSTPEGKAIAALHLPFRDDNLLIKPIVENWRLQCSYQTDWDREQFIQQTRAFIERGQIEDPKSTIADSPPERLVLHLVPFKQGMLYVGNSEPLATENITLTQDLADAFAVAYSRYEDFVKLEDAKKIVENTLTDLKSTQNQLIQSEKMASLGELTAGIAHEIQNPLNFVNNFSEVSGELIEELNEELEAGNLEDVKEITADLIQNLGKINHHGQRASGIVKGMLEHSRTGSSEKELTDINKLADEYLRLSYHGLRAKDKSFNADFVADLDPNLPHVNVITQDVGRVLLNLINNAFQAVSSEVLSDDAKDYKPKVELITKLESNKIIISVKDNGHGIPNNIRDKIFEPFFTTKPTGQGTGLGLSMSYDIISKGHGGELRVESIEGEGTEFIVELPIV